MTSFTVLRQTHAAALSRVTWNSACHVVSISSWLRQVSNFVRRRWASSLLIPSSAQSALLSRAMARRASINVVGVNPLSLASASSSRRSDP